MVSIVIPAHDEAAVVGRLLDGLLDGVGPDDLEIVVVCNGCTDDTAAVARTRQGIRVLETPVASKMLALRLGDSTCSTFPRLYVDADVALDLQSVGLLVEALTGPVLAAVPGRRLVLDHRPWSVRAYYRVWEHLPTVRDGLFGRGVIALSEQGHRLVSDLPPVTADDLWLHHAFPAEQTRVVPAASATIHAPRRLADLLRRRLRVVNGAREVRAHPGAGPGTSGTRISDVLWLARARVDLWPDMLVFLAVTLVARAGAWRAARRGEQRVWHRDGSSRSDG